MNVGDTIYIIRYALTSGVFKSKVRRTYSDGQCEVMGYYYRPQSSSVPVDQRYYLSEEAAMAAAEELREHKLGLLAKRIRKLEAKVLKVVEK